MHVRHAIQPSKPLNLIDIRLNEGREIFTVSTSHGYAIYRTWPLALLRKRDLSGGTLAIVQPMHTTSLLLLVGGRRSPLYPPNKVVIWDDAAGHEVAELEFRERVLGLACRNGWIAVALKRRVVVYQLENGTISRFREYETSINMRGLLSIATAPESTLLAMPGRQPGHVQLIHLPPCPSPPPPPTLPPPTLYSPAPPLPAPSPPPSSHSHSRAPISIIAAHKSPLSTLSTPASGRLLATTSENGTLVRIWDSWTGELVRELRRGSDRADIYGVAFRPDESEVAVWSDKGTVHVFSITGGGGEGSGSGSGKGNRQSTFQSLSPFLKLPKYFSSEWSYASYRLPAPTSHITLSSALRGGGERGDGGKRKDADTGEIIGGTGGEEDKCVVGWIEVPVRVRRPGHGGGARPPTPSMSAKGKGRAGSLPSSPRAKSSKLPDVPEDEEDAWVEEMQFQLVALTYSGCWYRLSVPSSSNSSSSSGSTTIAPSRTASSSATTARANPVPIPSSSSSTTRDRSSSSSAASPPRGSAASSYRPSPLSSTPPRSSPMHPQSSSSTSHTATTSASTARPTSVSQAGTVRPTQTRKSSARRGSTGSADMGDAGEKKAGSAAGGRKCTLEEFRRFGRWDGWI